MRERKAITLQLDSAKEGQGRAIFSSFNVIDHDGDVTLPGAFKSGQPVRLAQWGHNWSGPTIGTGIIAADTTKAWADIEFNLKMAAGRETYESVKFDAEHHQLQEWSYGYDIVDAEMGQFDGKDARMLKALDVIEVSPVMLGAGIGTATDFIKSAGLKLDDHALYVLASVQGLIERAQEVKGLRSKEGRTLSTATATRLSGVLEGMRAGITDLEALLSAATPSEDGKAAIAAERMRLLATEAQLLGVLSS